MKVNNSESSGGFGSLNKASVTTKDMFAGIRMKKKQRLAP